jgi:DNA-binding transcriptional LysR family regulator
MHGSATPRPTADPDLTGASGQDLDDPGTSFGSGLCATAGRPSSSVCTPLTPTCPVRSRFATASAWSGVERHAGEDRGRDVGARTVRDGSAEGDGGAVGRPAPDGAAGTCLLARRRHPLHRRCPAMASPTTGPVPWTMLNSPAGRPASAATTARIAADSGATSDGLSTTVQPASNAGATFAAGASRGTGFGQMPHGIAPYSPMTDIVVRMGDDEPVYPEFRPLALVEKIAEAGSFREAARLLETSQPTLSRQVAQLERHIGTPLLRRDRSGMSLTEAGHLVVRRSRRVMVELEALDGDLANLAEDRGRITVGASWNPALLAAHLVRVGLSVRAHELPEPDLFDGLHDGRTDLALGVVPPAGSYRPPPGCAAVAVGRVPLWAALPGGHRCSTWPVVPLAELADDPWLLPAAGAARALVDDACERAGFRPRGVVQASVEPLVAASAGAVGVLLTSPCTGPEHGVDLLLRPLAEPVWESRVVAWCTASLAPEVVTGIVERLQADHRAYAARTPEYRRWLDCHPSSLPPPRRPVGPSSDR